MTSFITKKSILALGVAAALGMSVAGPAHASAKAYAQLSVNDLRMFRSDGITQWDAANLSGLVFSDNFIKTARLDNQNDTTVGTGQLCFGICPGAPPVNLSQVGTLPIPPHPPAPDLSFSRSGIVFNNGAIITGVPGGNPPFVKSDEVSETYYNRTSNPNGNADNSAGTSASWNFTVGTSDPDALVFNGTLTGSLETFLGADSIGPGDSAQASANFAINLIDITDGSTSGSCNLLNRTISSNSPGNPPNTSPIGQPIVCTLPVLAGHEYQLTIDQRTRSFDQVDETRVPEPATLGLMGVGLIGLGALRRRSRKQA